MKKILMIAPASYPVFGAEAIVNMKLLKVLSDSGQFEIDLVSKKSKWEDYHSDPLDKYGVSLKSLNVVEVDNKISLKTIWEHFLSLIFFGIIFKGCHWAVKALPIVKKLVEKNDYDYVLTKNAPSLLLGYYLKKRYGIKWVATWNDPYPVIKYPVPYGKGALAKCSLSDRIKISIMQKWVDIHIFPSVRLRNHMMRYLKIPLDKTVIIPHVVFSNQCLDSSSLMNCETLKLIHPGNLKYPRDPHTFIEALKKFKQKYPESKIEVSIMGVFDDKLDKEIKDVGLQDVIKFIPPVSYNESLLVLKDYHVALIIEANCEEGIFLPTKVSDFMQCGKSIFAISPSIGVLNDLYEENVIPYFATITNECEIASTIGVIYDDFLTGKVLGIAKPKQSFLDTQIVKQYLKL